MKRKNILLAVTLVIAGLVISSTISIPAKVSTDSDLKNKKAIVQEMDGTIQCASLLGEKIELFRKPVSNNPVSTLMGDPAFTGPGDQIHPGLVRTESGILGAIYLDGNLDNASWEYSTDDGQTWTHVLTDNVSYDYPSIKLWEGERVFATAVPGSVPYYGYGGMTLLGEFPDMNDPSTFNSWGWTWNVTTPEYPYGFNNMTDADLACDDSQNFDEYGVISCVMSKTYENEHYTNIPFMQYADPDEFPTVWGRWSTWYTNCSHTDVDIDPTKQGSYRWIYALYDWNDTGDWKLLAWRVDFEAHTSAGIITIEGDGNLKYPAVAAYDNNIVILAETDENGNKDIICYYSDEGIFNLETSFVAEEVDDEMYPDVRHVQDQKFECTFVKGGKLYKSMTENGGETWSTPVEVDDNVVEEYKTSDLSEHAMRALYEVDNGDDIDIYFSEIGEGPMLPELTIDIKSGFGIGASATIENTGDADATNVEWTMTVTGGVLGMINKTKTGNETSLLMGADFKISSGLLLGFGPIEVTVSAECDEGPSGYETKEGTQIVIFTLVS
jgi:hypothetical protein